MMSETASRGIMTAAELAAHKAGEHGRDYRLSDDGYGDMEVAERRGWRVISSWGSDGWDLGEWPYVAVYAREQGGKFEMQQVCEGDHTLYQFGSEAERTAAITYLFLWYSADKTWSPLTWEDRERLDRGELEVPFKFCGPYSA
jgi:hypothetical protein